MEIIMAKPTVLLEIAPFLIPSFPSFIHRAAFMAQELEDRFGGVSLKLAGSNSVNIIAEFRWQGFKVIQVCDWSIKGAPGRIIVSSPFRTIEPSLFTWDNGELGNVFDLAFLDVLDRQLVRLNELKLNLENRRMIRAG